MSVAVTDLAANTLKKVSWTFGVQEPQCGQAEFYGLESSLASAFVINAQTSLTNGVLMAAYNPVRSELSWVENTRIKNITLLYRKTGSGKWLVAKDMTGLPAEFFDDVSKLCDSMCDVRIVHDMVLFSVCPVGQLWGVLGCLGCFLTRRWRIRCRDSR